MNRKEAQGILHTDICDAHGKIIRLTQYASNPLLIVNVACTAGFKQQVSELEACYQAHKTHGLVVLAIPAELYTTTREDLEQRPTDLHEYQDTHIHVFSKVSLFGTYCHPLFKKLGVALPGLFDTSFIKWHFTKFFIAPGGIPVKRFSPITHIELVSDFIGMHLKHHQ